GSGNGSDGSGTNGGSNNGGSGSGNSGNGSGGNGTGNGTGSGNGSGNGNNTGGTNNGTGSGGSGSGSGGGNNGSGAGNGSGTGNGNGSGNGSGSSNGNLGSTTVSGVSTTVKTVFDGYSESDLNALMDKWHIDSRSNRVSLESQALDRMLGVINDNSNYSYALKDLIISCSYNLNPCDYENDFEQLVDPDYGNCYTYNFNGKQTVHRLGKNYGLRLIAFSNVTD
uniref:Uncharacterized protein n=1 Tax=Panagrolaimus sp. JU765 TaxID=591449 RepID=A0AC34R6U0_9BILA